MNKAIDVTAWTVPSLNLVQELQNPIEDFTDKAYTIINDSCVFRSRKELGEFLEAEADRNLTVKNIVEELVTFKPERIAFHALITEVSLKIKVSNEGQFQKTVYDLWEILTQDDGFKEVIRNAYKSYKEVQQRVETAVQELFADTFNSQKPISQGLQNLNNDNSVITNIFNYFYSKDIKCGKHVDNYNKKELITAKATDKIYKNDMVPKIKAYIEKLIEEFVKENSELSIDIPNPNQRLTLMICGGQASGKSGALEIAKLNLSSNNIDFDNFIKINTDSYKPLLLEPGSVNKYYYSQLAQPEASFVHSLIQDKVKYLVTNKKAPHLYVDQVYLGNDKLDFSLEGKGVAAYLISTDVEDAIERSFGRGEAEREKGRFEHTSGILLGHKGMSKAFTQDIFNYIDRNLSILILDNNVLPKSQPTKIMTIDLKSKIGIIYDDKKLQRFFKKIAINHEAKKRSEVYVPNFEELTKKEYDNFYQKLKENGIQLTSVQDIISKDNLIKYIREDNPDLELILAVIKGYSIDKLNNTKVDNGNALCHVASRASIFDDKFVKPYKEILEALIEVNVEINQEEIENQDWIRASHNNLLGINKNAVEVRKLLKFESSFWKNKKTTSITNNEITLPSISDAKIIKM